jgi:hypothetical protein
MVVVVLATPPFWFTTAIISVIDAYPSARSSAILKYHSIAILSRVYTGFGKTSLYEWRVKSVENREKPIFKYRNITVSQYRNVTIKRGNLA